MDTIAKAYFFTRQTIATLDVSKRYIEFCLGGSATATGVLASVHADATIFGILTFVLSSIRFLLSYVISASVATNPINVTNTKDISQPEPIISLPTDEH